MKVSVFRKTHFNAAHRLYRADWTTEKNDAVFGLCSNPHYHGHNYELIVKVKGEIDPETGFVMDLKVLKDIVKQKVLLPLDHKNLNEQVEEFKSLNPTAENIAVVIWQRLRPHICSNHELSIRLYETPRNFVEFDGEGLS
ncbi:UNVERIFIED_CONTAM: hypothetical protein GTU68_002653 [Idotea baltica]|nr:hypothetical protein [Idotea baltica]